MAKFNKIDDFNNYKVKLSNKKIKILIGMGTCGIAAGAKKVMKVIEEELKSKNLLDVEIKQVGCLGLCYSEPNVEVLVEDMPSVLYGKVNEDLAKEIVRSHIVHKSILETNIVDKPYIDVYKN